jgi:hypothetical protein
VIAFRNTILGLGVVLPFSIAGAYLIRIVPGNDAVVIGVALLNCLLSVLAAIALGRHLNEKLLILAGLAGYIVLFVMVTLFVRKATAPIEWRKTSSPTPGSVLGEAK